MLRIEWSCGDLTGTELLAPGAKLVVARRMALPEQQLVATERVDGSRYVFLRLPYASDPALVVTATDGQPVVYRGQRANGAIVELTTPSGQSSSPAPKQRFSLTESGSRLELRLPDVTVALTVDIGGPDTGPDSGPRGSGTEQLGVEALQGEDAWIVAAIAVALSPEHGVVSHGDLKHAFAVWRGIEEPSAGTFERNVLRPALESRRIELPGARLNKIVYLVEWCRRTSEFPDRVLADVRRRLDASGAPTE
ncbi:hypothetical protein ACHAAC_07620 [Aeromicrobium sp. CF4.19]|uniref:hypothetical protein n=1 Tax=Aeromicrobium sp. CF4.19 TaxID=3373082 RepID=UPI003EE7E700